MKNQLIIVFVLITLFLSHFSVYGQVNKCALDLLEAKEQFNAGQIEAVPGLLLDCIDGGFTPDERIEALKLLINAYIFDDYPENAEKYMMVFLNDYPEYQVTEDDPFEFVNLIEQFDNRTRYSLGFQMGSNMAGVIVTEPFGVYNVSEVSGDYSSLPGFLIGGSFNYYIRPDIELSLEAVYSRYRFKYEVTPFPFTTTEYTEMQEIFNFPVSVVYSFNDDKISPYLRFGFNSSILLSAKGEAMRSFSNTGGVVMDDIQGRTEDVSDKRVPFSLSAFLGGGGRYNIPKAFIFFELRYNIGFTSQVVPETRRDAGNDNIWLFYNQQDEFSLNNFSFTMGFTRKFYNPKRKNL